MILLQQQAGSPPSQSQIQSYCHRCDQDVEVSEAAGSLAWSRCDDSEIDSLLD